MDLVSLIVPIYNAEKYLEDCIKSILNQTYKNIELILVNDGSTDDSLEICNVYKEIDNRIKVVSKVNSGVSDTRNHGINSASGKYLCFVDSDDMLKSNFVKKLHREITSDNADVVFCNFEYSYEGILLKKKPRLPSRSYNISEIEQMIIDNGTMSGILFGSVCVAIYRKVIIEEYGIEFNRDIRFNEDGLFNIEYCLHTTNIKVLSHEYLYIYRQVESPTKKIYSFENRTAAATAAIAKLCKNREISMNLQQQFGARKVSEAFWMVLELCSKNNLDKYSSIIKKLKMLLDDDKLKYCYQYVNTNKLNKYKYVYYLLMKNQNYRILLILTRYIYPIFKSIVSR